LRPRAVITLNYKNSISGRGGEKRWGVGWTILKKKEKMSKGGGIHLKRKKREKSKGGINDGNTLVSDKTDQAFREGPLGGKGETRGGKIKKEKRPEQRKCGYGENKLEKNRG